MQRKGPLPGKIFAWCILQRRFAGHFEYMESISCQNQLILDAWRRYLATKGRFYRLRLLQECIRVIFCQEFTSSSVRKCSSKMLRPGPFVCAGERKVVSAVFCLRQSVSSVPWGFGRCGAAELRAPESPLMRMAAERAEHEQVQVQVRVRARMPLLPPRCCGVLAGGSAIACCMALTCCSAIARCGRWRALPPRHYGVAGVDGSDAYRAEAEPFTVKRSGTGWWVFPMLFIVIKWLP